MSANPCAAVNSMGYRLRLSSQRRPHAAVRNPGKLNAGMGVEHREAVDLVYAGVEVASEVRQHGALQIFIFEIERSPLSRTASVHEVMTQGVGIIEESA